VPVYDALRAALPEWRALGASTWVLDTIEHGVKIDWVDRPPYFRSKEYPMGTDDTAFMTGEIARGLQEGYIEAVTCPRKIANLVCISSAFVAHTGHKPRAVYDLKHPNEFQGNAACKYETLQELSMSLRPNDALLSWDIRDAYHHLRIRPADRTYLAFRTLGRVFVPITMPFGLRVAPRTWTKVCRPLVQELRRLGFRIIAYVDDFGGAPPAPAGVPATRAQAVAAFDLVAKLLARLGLYLHPRKGTRDGPTEMQLLGHVIDTRAGIFRLPTERVSKTAALAAGLARYATSHERWVSFKALRRFCGTAVSTTLSVPAARLHLRSLFNALQFRHPRTGDARLGNQAVQDLRWWVDLDTNSLGGRPIWPGAATVQMDTDASGVGWGAVLGGLLEARGFHGTLRSGLHINVLELGAITLALRSFRADIPPGTIIRLRTDSMVALGVLNAQSSRSLVLMEEYRALHALCAEMDVELRAEHLSSALNEWADRLSRENDSTVWTLAAASFTRLDALFGPHTVDLFTTELDARCPRFYIRWAAPGTLGVNAMAHRWTGENAWANPPFHMLGPVVHKIITEGATVTLIAPAWRAQPWWRRATEAATDWWLLPVTDGVGAQGTRSAPGQRPHWRTAVFRFAPVECATTASDGTTSSLA